MRNLESVTLKRSEFEKKKATIVFHLQSPLLFLNRRTALIYKEALWDQVLGSKVWEYCIVKSKYCKDFNKLKSR